MSTFDAPAAGRARLSFLAGGLLLIASFAPLTGGLLQFSALYGVRWPSRAVRLAELGHVAAAVAVFFWLSWVVIARTTLDRTGPRRRLLHRGAAVVSGALAIYTAAPGTGSLLLGRAVFGCVVAWLALEVCRAQGLDLDKGVGTSAVYRGRAQVWNITQWSMAACAVGAGVTYVLQEAFRRFDMVNVPVMEGDQLSTLGLFGLGDLVFAVVWAVAIEDVVIVAAVTALLTAARWSSWQIYAVVCVIEVVIHGYFGVPAIGMALYAAGRVWLYRRYGRFIPLLVGHMAVDLWGGMTMQLPVIYRLMAAVVLLPVLSLIDRWVQDPATTPSDSPPLPPARTLPHPQGTSSGGDVVLAPQRRGRGFPVTLTRAAPDRREPDVAARSATPSTDEVFHA